MAEGLPELVPPKDPTGRVIDVAAVVTSAVPWLGGPVSTVLSGMSVARKMTRVREVLIGLSEDLADFRSEVSEQYVKTEEFEDLLENTLKRVTEERDDERRRRYRDFLVAIIKTPEGGYDEKLRALLSVGEIDEGEFLSPAATQIAEFLLRKSETGRWHDPELSVEDLKAHLELPDDEIEDAVSELKDRGLVGTNPLGFGSQGFRIWAEDAIFTELDSQCMPWDPAKDAVVLAAALLDNGDNGLASQVVDERLGWGPRRMNPALNYLVSQDVVLASRTGHPRYTHAWIHKNDRTRRFVRDNS